MAIPAAIEATPRSSRDHRKQWLYPLDHHPAAVMCCTSTGTLHEDPYLGCREAQYNISDQYDAAVSKVMQALLDNGPGDADGYYFKVTDTDPKAYGRAMCHTVDGCGACLSTVANWIHISCPRAMGATAIFDICTIRYEFYTFY